VIGFGGGGGGDFVNIVGVGVAIEQLYFQTIPTKLKHIIVRSTLNLTQQ